MAFPLNYTATILKRWLFIGIPILLVASVAALVLLGPHNQQRPQDVQQGGTHGTNGAGSSNAEYSVPLSAPFDENHLPKLIQADFVDVNKIDTISQFRSGAGHDFTFPDSSGRNVAA